MSFVYVYSQTYFINLVHMTIQKAIGAATPGTDTMYNYICLESNKWTMK